MKLKKVINFQIEFINEGLCNLKKNRNYNKIVKTQL